MYHYVRDLQRSRFPAIKGRDTAAFVRQLDYIDDTFTVVTAEHVIAAAQGRDRLPDNAAWLTFDDGYLDHWSTVFPLLQERGWQGTFFPPASTSRDRILLDVNRVHFVLASCDDPTVLVEEIRRFVEEHQGDDGVRPFADYWAEYAVANRFDPAEVIFVKRTLQHALPGPLRAELAKALFAKYVAADETEFAAELYLSVEQLTTMVQAGMFVGSHGSTHAWLNHLDAAGQDAEVDGSLAFLREVGAPTDDWILCYPYGGYDDRLLATLPGKGCALGVTTEARVADLGTDNPLTLPRLDTNDLPS
jgi:peptidoglycan/xylan/chitin deacetylase (PgdA/CDA1 family)